MLSELGVASRLLIPRTVGNQTWSEFVSSSENFNLVQEKCDTIDGPGDSDLDFRPVKDGVLEVVSPVDVKTDLRRVSKSKS